MKLLICIQGMGSSALERFGDFYKMDVPGHGTPHVYERRAYDEGDLEEFHRDLRRCATDDRYNTVYRPVLVIALPEEKKTVVTEKPLPPLAAQDLPPTARVGGVLEEPSPPPPAAKKKTKGKPAKK